MAVVDRNWKPQKKGNIALCFLVLGIFAIMILSQGFGLGLVFGFFTGKFFNKNLEDKKRKDKFICSLIVFICFEVMLLAASIILFVYFTPNNFTFMPLNAVWLAIGDITLNQYLLAFITTLLISSLLIFFINFFMYDDISNWLFQHEKKRIEDNLNYFKQNRPDLQKDENVFFVAMQQIYNFKKLQKEEDVKVQESKKQEHSWKEGIVVNDDVLIHKSALGRNTLVFGTTGAGKTNLFMLMNKHFILNKQRVIFLDLKGSTGLVDDFRNVCAKMSKTLNRKINFKYFVQFADTEQKNDPDCIKYDLFSGKTNEDIIAMIMAARKIEKVSADASYYADKEKNFLDIYIPLARWKHGSLTVDNLIKTCYQKKIDEIINHLSKHIDSIKVPAKKLAQKRSLESLHSKWLSFSYDKANLAAVSQVNSTLNKINGYSNRYSGFGVDKGMNMSSLIQNNECDVLLISLAGLKQKIYAKFFGEVIVNDVRAVCALNKKEGMETAFFMDEFGVIATEDNIELFNKMREFGFKIIFSTQSPADLDAVSKTYTAQLIDNCSTVITFRLHDPKSSEYLSKQFAVVKRLERAYQLDNSEIGIDKLDSKASAAVGDHFKITPDEIRELPDYCCFARTLTKHRKMITFDGVIKVDPWNKENV